MLDLLRKAGAPAVSFGLMLSLLLWYLLLLACGAITPGWQPLDLISFRLYGVLLLLNLSLGLAGALQQKERTRLCFCLAGLLLLAATVYCYLFRFEGALSLAEGESYEPSPIAFSSGQKGLLAPFPQLAFTLTRVNPDGRMGRGVIVQKGVPTEIDSRWLKIGASEIRLQGTALAPLIVVSGKDKGELERSYVKIDLTGGKEQAFEFDTLPYQFVLRAEKGKGQELFHLHVRRGKMSLFDGVAPLGGTFAVQGLDVRIEDQRKFALLEIRTRRGMAVMQAAAALFALVCVAALGLKLKG